jgi:hypothetical protein
MSLRSCGLRFYSQWWVTLSLAHPAKRKPIDQAVPEILRQKWPQPHHHTALVWSNPDEVWGKSQHPPAATMSATSDNARRANAILAEAKTSR